MKTVFIVGGDGFARECYCYLQEILYGGERVNFGGFLGHNGYGHAVDYKSVQHLYKGDVSDYIFQENEYVVIGAAYPKLRLKIYEELKQRNVQFFNIIGKNVYLTPTVKIGEANVITGMSTFTADIEIGNGNVFNGHVTVGHDSKIGNFNFFGPRAQVLGDVKIGNNNMIGANGILLAHCKIGNNNKIAPLSAVYKGCRDNCYMLGNPALKEGTVE